MDEGERGMTEGNGEERQEQQVGEGQESGDSQFSQLVDWPPGALTRGS